MAVQAQQPVLIDDLSFRDDATRAIDSLYNRKPDAAREILNPWMEDHPDHPLWALWDGMELWWDILQDLSNEGYDKEFYEKMSRADYRAAQVLRRQSDHPDALIVRAIANGYSARHHANRGDWLTSVNIGRRAYQAYTRLMDVSPDLPDNDFAIGMKRYYSAFLPENYPVVRAISWFLPDGDKEKGLAALQTASEEGVFARPEATYFLGNILLNYENQYREAAVWFSKLAEMYPDNAYYHRLYVRTLMQMRQFPEAAAHGEAAVEHWEKHGLTDEKPMLEEIYYWLGRSYYQRGGHERARDYFVKSYEVGLELPDTRNREFHTLAAYYAGRASERMNDPSEARKYYRLALDQRAGDQARKQADERLNRL